MTVLRGKLRRDLRDFIAFGWAEWEHEFETSEFYQRERAAHPHLTIEPFERQQVLNQIPSEYDGVQLRGRPFVSGGRGPLLVSISPAFVRECQAAVPRIRRLLDEFPPKA